MSAEKNMKDNTSKEVLSDKADKITCQIYFQAVHKYFGVTRALNGVNFKLPTESEWEYASRGGLDASPYPWGGPYTRNIQGCFLANFKPLRGNYIADGQSSIFIRRLRFHINSNFFA